jgi:hypothetical protein
MAGVRRRSTIGHDGPVILRSGEPLFIERSLPIGHPLLAHIDLLWNRKLASPDQEKGELRSPGS